MCATQSIQESVEPLSPEHPDAISTEGSPLDWTAQVIEDAELSDLSDEALAEARRAFKENNSSKITSETVDGWSDEEFLSHLGVVTECGVTRAAILLFGKYESRCLLDPHHARITWMLMGQGHIYDQFTVPFVLSTTWLYDRIRNYETKLLDLGRIIRREIEKYERVVVLEAIHNCLAHQDYTQYAHITVREYEDRLELISRGSFFDGNPNDYTSNTHTLIHYRNAMLVRAMAQLGMIGHPGFDIAGMYCSRARRCLPLPEFDFSHPGEVRLILWNCAIEGAYSRRPMCFDELPNDEIVALNRVRNGRSVTDGVLKRLRRRGLVEGRKPHLRVVSDVANADGAKAGSTERFGGTDDRYMMLICGFIMMNGLTTRADIIHLLESAMPSDATHAQCVNKADNLRRKMRSEYGLTSRRVDGKRVWVLP